MQTQSQMSIFTTSHEQVHAQKQVSQQPVITRACEHKSHITKACYHNTKHLGYEISAIIRIEKL